MTSRSGFVMICLFLTGCGQEAASPNRFATSPSPPGSYRDPYAVDANLITFPDHLDSNTELDDDLLSLEFISRDGLSTPLSEIAAGKNLVLVMTRGYSGSICPYCTTQVSRLIANYDEFEKRNSQIVVIYPVASQSDARQLEELVKRALSMLPATNAVPFPVLLDVELKGVDALGIRKDLSKPATYILDSEGRLQFAYVGNSLADRPSVKALLEKLDTLPSIPPRS